MLLRFGHSKTCHMQVYEVQVLLADDELQYAMVHDELYYTINDSLVKTSTNYCARVRAIDSSAHDNIERRAIGAGVSPWSPCINFTTGTACRRT